MICALTLNLLFFILLFYALRVEFGFNDINTRDFETGVEYDDDVVQLSDHRTTVHVKGEDHPSPFAQGVPDGTHQGMYFPSTSTAEQAAASSNASNSRPSDQHSWVSHGPAWGPEEMAAEMGCPVRVSGGIPPRRKFHARDKELQFTAHEEFSGRREGYVFRLGAMGVGYYEDRPLTETEIQLQEEAEEKHEGI